MNAAHPIELAIALAVVSCVALFAVVVARALQARPRLPLGFALEQLARERQLLEQRRDQYPVHSEIYFQLAKKVLDVQAREDRLIAAHRPGDP